ncbi:MAG: PQQ-dependent catabolism-associated CXXCW motif protein [Methylocystis sp.]
MKKIAWIGIVALCAIFAAAVATQAQEAPPPEPEGYRMEKYHAPTPATLKGATVIDTPQAFDFWTRKAAVFIDAIARPKRPADFAPDKPWVPEPRRNIPGSLWLADTGFGELSPDAQRYFEDGLARATNGDKSKAIVFYCRTNCWASWNAGKRAMTLGYTNIYWYPGGADAWEGAGHPLEEKGPPPCD